MSAKTVELNKSNALDYLTKSQSPFSKDKSSKKNEFRIGVPQPNLTNDWWTIFTSIPASENPISPKNEGIIDDIPQFGDVHFWGGVLGSNKRTNVISRDVTISEDQTIVFPILTSGADNVGWNFSDEENFSYLGGFPGFPVPYLFSIEDLQILADAVMDTAKKVSLVVNKDLLISDANKDNYRQRSQEPYILNLPSEDDILSYRGSYPENEAPGWVDYPYTQGVQDGIWVQLENLSPGENTIRFRGTLDYGDIVVEDYNHSGSIGDTPLEYLLDLLQGTNSRFSVDVTYNVDVISQSAFNTQLGI